MAPSKHHIEVSNFLKEKLNGDAKVTAYRDNNGSNPIPIGEFGANVKKLYSTIGAFDMHLKLPAGNFELASCGEMNWLPNAVASSIYWLRERTSTEWPLVCEDVIKQNAKSQYRHMAFVPSEFKLKISTAQEIKWLLGVPITDKEIGISSIEVLKKAQSIYPGWFFKENA